MVSYSNIKTAATKAVKDFGRAVTIVRNGTERHTTLGVFVDYRPIEREGGLIQDIDQKLLLPADLTITPNKETDEIEDSTGKMLEIIDVKLVQPGPVNVMFILS